MTQAPRPTACFLYPENRNKGNKTQTTDRTNMSSSNPPPPPPSLPKIKALHYVERLATTSGCSWVMTVPDTSSFAPTTTTSKPSELEAAGARSSERNGATAPPAREAERRFTSTELLALCIRSGASKAGEPLRAPVNVAAEMETLRRCLTSVFVFGFQDNEEGNRGRRGWTSLKNKTVV